MEIRHHAPDALLMGYAAGTLPEAFNLVIATHVSLSDDARARLGAMEAVGGSVLDGCTAEMAAGSLDRALDRVSTTPQANARVPLRADGVFPAPLADFVGHGLDDVRWASVGMGVKQAILRNDGGATVRLLRIPAGRAMPDHGHGGMELTLVLQGAFVDGNNRYGRGDLEVADQDMDHTPVAAAGEDCICLAATDAPLRFRGWLPRLAQPFFKI
jgi:putative transcriptional regulator